MSNVTLPPVPHALDLDSGIQAKSQIYGVTLDKKMEEKLNLPHITTSPRNKDISR